MKLSELKHIRSHIYLFLLSFSIKWDNSLKIDFILKIEYRVHAGTELERGGTLSLFDKVVMHQKL